LRKIYRDAQHLRSHAVIRKVDYQLKTSPQTLKANDRLKRSKAETARTVTARIGAEVKKHQSGNRGYVGFTT
jgi:hypothetical protein